MFRIRKGKKLQPVHLKKKLVSAMRDEKRELPYGNYAPNRYIIFLNPEDSKKWRGLKVKAITQLKKYLEEQIQKEEYELEGSVAIEIQESDEVNAGHVRIEAALVDEIGEEAPEDDVEAEDDVEEEIIVPEEEEPDISSGEEPLTEPSVDEEADIGTIPLEELEESIGTIPLEEEEILPGLIKLVVTAGESEGEEFLLPQKQVLVGRMGGDADIALVDNSRHISRRQFELVVQEEDKLLITDLPKREDVHVYVNEEQVDEGSLKPGDKIRIGSAKTTLAEMEVVLV